MDRAVRDLITAKDPNLPLEVRVAAGARLWDQINHANAALEFLKADLRAEAKRKLNGEAGATTIEGTGMTRALVTVPEASLQILKGTNMAALKRELGPAVFSSMFEEVVTYKCRPTASARIHKLSTKEQSAVLTAVREVEGTPRVSLQFAGADILEMHSGSDSGISKE
jgi:hypothetical protein